MGDGLLALLLMLGGLGCIVAWCICQAVVAIRAHRLQREADVIKLHVIKGGRLPDGAPMILARSYLQVRWLGIVGNILLLSGIVGVVMAHIMVL
ncbi:MAG: hypothetical protein E4H18_00165 [Hyphomicrobiales bacterium]|nr:MAG: hypothetical protein E4H18_00165 [Hyphomicrobiales bacterium]